MHPKGLTTPVLWRPSGMRGTCCPLRSSAAGALGTACRRLPTTGLHTEEALCPFAPTREVAKASVCWTALLAVCPAGTSSAPARGLRGSWCSETADTSSSWTASRFYNGLCAPWGLSTTVQCGALRRWSTPSLTTPRSACAECTKHCASSSHQRICAIVCLLPMVNAAL